MWIKMKAATWKHDKIYCSRNFELEWRANAIVCVLLLVVKMAIAIYYVNIDCLSELKWIKTYAIY